MQSSSTPGIVGKKEIHKKDKIKKNEKFQTIYSFQKKCEVETVRAHLLFDHLQTSLMLLLLLPLVSSCQRAQFHTPAASQDGTLGCGSTPAPAGGATSITSSSVMGEGWKQSREDG